MEHADDARFMRLALEVAREAREKGNHPFGAILVGPSGDVLLTGENTVVTDSDCSGHAESSLISQACKQYDSDFLAKCTLYATTEPCPMCAGAIFWGNVRRVVYGLSQAGLYGMTAEDSEEVLRLPCREIFARGPKSIEVVGPVLEDEARKVHVGFWS